jgi:DNA-binding SARP family transcriptional activator
MMGETDIGAVASSGGKGATGCHFGLLGPLEVWRDGAPVVLGGPRQRAVLALLVLNGNYCVPLETLIDAVWSGRPSPGAVSTARTYVHHLRQVLEPGGSPSILVTEGRGYRLRVERSQVDAWVFRDQVESARAALQRGEPQLAADVIASALGLWRGPMLADLGDYDFARQEADRFEELRLVALELRAVADLGLGRQQVVIGDLEELVRRHPLREGLHELLMLAYYRSGRQAEALAAYRNVRGVLADDLGVEPGLPLQRLHAAVLAQDPALDGPERVAERRRDPPLPERAGSGPAPEVLADPVPTSTASARS